MAPSGDLLGESWITDVVKIYFKNLRVHVMVKF